MNTKTRYKAPAVKRRLTDAFLRHLKPTDRTRMVWDDKQSGFGVQITPMGTVSFKVTYRHKGRLRWYTLDKYPSIGLADAREAAQKIRARAALGEDPQGDKVADREGETLRDVAERYVEQFAKLNNKSWRQGKSLMSKYVLPKLGARLIRDIRHLDILDLFNKLSAKKRYVIANQVVAAVSAVLRWAREQRLIEQNVAQGIRRNKVKAEERYLTDEEVKLIWPDTDQTLRLILVTAQRPGEVAKMQWDHVDLSKQLWTLPGEPDGTWPGTKNARTHEVPLSPQAMVILNELGPREDGPVFNGRIPTTQPIWKILGLPRFRPHSLRATCASGLDRLGINRENISRILNHVEGGITAGYIRHGALSQKRMALDAWGNHLQTILEGGRVPSSVVDIRSAL